MDISESNIGCGVYQLYNLRDGSESWVIDENTIRAADLISTTPADKWT